MLCPFVAGSARRSVNAAFSPSSFKTPIWSGNSKDSEHSVPAELCITSSNGCVSFLTSLKLKFPDC